MEIWSFKDCSKCGGDLKQDEDVWRCWQCGRYYYQNLVQLVHAPLERAGILTSRTESAVSKAGGYGARIDRNINSVIQAQYKSDEKWSIRNSQVIAYLDEGRSVSEIAQLTARGQRQIRVVRERLMDIKAEARS